MMSVYPKDSKNLKYLKRCKKQIRIYEFSGTILGHVALIQNAMHKEMYLILRYFMEERMEHGHIPEPGETEMFDLIAIF
ncbi:hypothetical protein HGM15179_016927 [Zosterops borbonicus]|uniref:Uncharacterized protein n=1 Tax=Zosterops borbonicus TaxID=364589 RepID=A0A8K1G1X4_9PASS|nr:hypothetical protein HGM15179_016927 [Zosterops borbonicus]